jgi:hypothetical protein
MTKNVEGKEFRGERCNFMKCEWLVWPKAVKGK